MELTILMPCLNEAATVADCVREAATYLKSRNIPGEILVVDNGSNDHSRELAAAAGGRVIIVPESGYGNAIRGGILAANGKYIIIGDCDGVVVIPAADAEAVLERAKAKKVAEDEIRQKLLAGVTTAELFDLYKKFN